jgi:hypothetical protein
MISTPKRESEEYGAKKPASFHILLSWSAFGRVIPFLCCPECFVPDQLLSEGALASAKTKKPDYPLSGNPAI